MARILIIDDERILQRVEKWAIFSRCSLVYARTLEEARHRLNNATHWERVYLDHDLGVEQVSWLTDEIERDAHAGLLYDVGEFIIHSMNPIGRMKMYEALHKFYNVKFARVEDLL